MDVDALQTILTDRLDAEVDGTEYELPEDREVTALLKTGSELVHVTDVQLIEFDDETTTLVTRQAEYFVEPTDVFGIKLEDSRIRTQGRPGFRRDDA